MARARKTASAEIDDDEAYTGGLTPHADAGLSLAALRAGGFFDAVTDAHRAKAKAYFARIETRRRAAMQPDLVEMMGVEHGA